MASAAATVGEPAPGQFITKRRRKRSWERGIIYDPDTQSVKIKARAKIEEDTTKYMSCALPTHLDFVDIFVVCPESEPFAVSAAANQTEAKIFIGRLNLKRLGIKNQFLRFFGNLKTLYIVKHTSSTPDGEEAISERDSISY